MILNSWLVYPKIPVYTEYNCSRKTLYANCSCKLKRTKSHERKKMKYLQQKIIKKINYNYILYLCRRENIKHKSIHIKHTLNYPTVINSLLSNKTWKVLSAKRKFKSQLMLEHWTDWERITFYELIEFESRKKSTNCELKRSLTVYSQHVWVTL